MHSHLIQTHVLCFYYSRIIIIIPNADVPNLSHFFLKVLEIITISSINASHSFQILSSVLIIFHF